MTFPFNLFPILYCLTLLPVVKYISQRSRDTIKRYAVPIVISLRYTSYDKF